MHQFFRLTALILTLSVASHVFGDQSSDHEVGLRENTPDVWALLHVKIVSSTGPSVDDATVVIRDGKIVSVTTAGVAPADARKLDLSGKTIYPGFIDAYSELGLSADRIKGTAKHWNVNVVPQMDFANNFIANSKNERLRRQGIVAQLRAPSTKVIRGMSAVISTGTDDVNTAIIANRVAQHIELAVSVRSRTVYPGSPMGAVALARQTMYDAQWYRDAWNVADSDPTLPRPERNAALVALQPLLTRKMPVIAEASNELFHLRADRFANEFGLNLIVRGSGKEYRRLSDIAATKRAVILPLDFSQPPNVSTSEVAENVTLESLMHWDLAAENPARVAAANIRFAFCTDELDSVDDFLRQLRKAVERGLTKRAALRALTQTPAEMFSISEQLGTVEAGKLASLIVTDGDIFEKKTKVLETWVAGRRFEHDPEPHQDLTGRFEVRLQSSDNLADKLYVELERGGKKSAGRVSAKPFRDDEAKKRDADEDESEEGKSESATVELKNTSLLDFVASGQFEAKPFGIEGMARLSLVFSKANESKIKNAAVGQVVWPNGKVAVASAIRMQATSLDENSEDKESENAETLTAKASFPVNFPLGAYGRTTPPEAAGPTAFVNATIWTCGQAGVIRKGTMLIDNGKVIAVGRRLQLPKDVARVDVQGMHITPGIIDCHSHMATDGGVNESTQSITCEVRVGDFIDCDDIAIYRQLAGGTTTSNILHGSANPIGGQNQVIKLRWGLNDEQMKMAEAPQGVKFALGENVKHSNRGDDFTTRYPQTRMGVEQLFRDAFHAAKEYGDRVDSYKKKRQGLPPRRDLELDALREIVEQKRWIHCHSYRQDEILALIRVLDEFGVTIGTFQHILEGYKVADEMARHGAMASAFSDWWAYKLEVYDAIPYGGALMHKAGIVVSFNSDDSEIGARLNQEAAKAVKYGGVPAAEALKFVTLNPAKQLRIDEYVGSLEAGKQADFVVWTGPPLSNFSRCEQTWIDGAKYFDRIEDAATRKSVFEMRNTLIQKILASGEKMRGVGAKDDDPSAMWLRHDEFCRASGHEHGFDH